MNIRELDDHEREWARDALHERWGSDTVVAHGTIYEPATLRGLVAEDGNRIVGLLTYHVDGDACEVVTIDSFEEGRGVGTALLEAAKGLRCTRLWLVTTNNNVRAQRLYERCGFRLVALREGQVALSRELKPEIPEADEAGRPIRDELEYEFLPDH